MKLESIEDKDQKDIFRDENGRDYLKTLISPEGSPQEVDPIDMDEINNPQYVGPYVNDIMAHLRDTEVNLAYFSASYIFRRKSILQSLDTWQKYKPTSMRR